MADADLAPTPWPNEQSQYELKEIIGMGSTARVYCAHCIPRNEKCAVKVINISKCNTTAEDILRKIKVVSSYIHSNLVSYYASFIVNDTIWLISDLLEGGSLRDIINYKMMMRHNLYGVFDEFTIATILKYVLKGLEYLNKNGQSHRDIKTSNILIGDSGTVKITDFGMTAWLASGRNMSQQDDFVGSPCWMAPEVINRDEKSNSKSDIWSVGITAIEMATGNPPYYKYSPMKVVKLTLLNDPPNLDTGAEKKGQYHKYGKTFRKFISFCLNKDPDKRPTVTELLQHPFLNKAKDRKLLIQTVVSVGPSYATRILKTPTTGPVETVALERLDSTERNNGNVPDSVPIAEEQEGSQMNDQRQRGRLSRMRQAWSDFTERLRSLIVDSETTSELESSGAEVEENHFNQAVELLNQAEHLHDEVGLYPIVLRVRIDGLMHTTSFWYLPELESSEALAGALVANGCLNPQDVPPFAAAMTNMLQSETDNKSATFLLNSADPNESFDESTLTGFGHIHVATRIMETRV